MIFVVCTKYPDCDGPGVAMYGDDFVQRRSVEQHQCGFCEAAMRLATDVEKDAYREANPHHFPPPEPEPLSEPVAAHPKRRFSFFGKRAK